MAIESPCILVCSINEESGYCLGCGRTRDEIAGWLSMTPGERRAVMDGLPARLADLERTTLAEPFRAMPSGRRVERV